MNDYKLIYFSGCPNFKPAEKMLIELGLKFEIISQDNLTKGSAYSNYTSPTLLKGNKIIFGSESTSSGCSLSLPSKEELLKLL